MISRQLAIISVLAAALTLCGCGAAVVGGAFYGGYKGAADERTIGTIMDDSVISTTVKSKMIADEFVMARHIDVDVISGVVYLIGVVESASQKRMAADIARGVEGVTQVKNQLIVGKTTAGQALNDTLTTSKIKTEFLKDPDIRSTNIDVDTNNAVVTLTGIVTSQKEKNKALAHARKITGNQAIVDNLTVGN